MVVRDRLVLSETPEEDFLRSPKRLRHVKTLGEISNYWRKDVGENIHIVWSVTNQVISLKKKGFKGPQDVHQL